MRLVTKFGLLLAVLLLVGAVWFYLSSDNTQPAEKITCADISKGCEVDGINFSFDHIPRVMQPFDLKMELQNATEVHASFAMQGMDMGLNRYRLLQKTSNLWAAQIILPVCVRGRSDWLMLLEVKTASGLQRYELAFKSG
ncbi:MAG TPA: hypothetical protein VIE91_00570 [Methylophilaceae bacterium]|jgi:hypothetical protein